MQGFMHFYCEKTVLVVSTRNQWRGGLNRHCWGL